MRKFNGARVRASHGLYAVFATVFMTSSMTAIADEGVIAGFFRGSEGTAASIGVTCPENPDRRLPYRVISGVTASIGGDYDFSNTGHHYSGNTQIAFYSSFDPENPTANRIGWTEVDSMFDNGALQLQAGTEYTVVVQAINCDSGGSQRGEWSFTYRGPGALNGPDIYPLPAYGSGSITSSSSTFTSPACGITRYVRAGPIQVPVTGEYRYSDASVHFDLDIEVHIYAGSFDTNNPEANLYRILDDGETVTLEEGIDYVFITAPWGCSTTNFGDYQYLLLGPSGEFIITEGVSGAWANTDTLGQGQFMEVYPDRNLLFAAWFTWDTTQPGSGAMANVGDSNHRWLTAQGGYEGDTATLDITLTRGGLFDDPTKATNEPDPVGTMTLRFLSCNEAVLTYELGELGRSFTINKLADDNNATCEMLRNQHKVPVQ
ncbi:MAG: hypothetical protein P8Y52_09520 [Xanthomonadales bacterium]